jgi:hypothetical protein
MPGRDIRAQATRARAALRPTVQVKIAQAAVLALALGVVAGLGSFLLVRAALHLNPFAGVFGALVLVEAGRELGRLLGWWQQADRSREPVPIVWQMQLAHVVVAGLIVAGLVLWVAAWLRT